MFEKIKVLTLLQLSEKIKLKRSITKNERLAVLGRTLAAMAISYGILVLLLLVIFKVMFFRPSSELFTFVIFLMQIISIFVCTISLSDSLYISKDNQLLLSYPVSHTSIYISKILVAYLLELKKSLLFTFPLFMAYATMASGVISLNYVLSSIFYSIVLPLFPVLIGAIISIPLSYISKLVKKSGIAKIILTILVFTILTLLTIKIVSIIPENIRIVALYNSFLNKVTNALSKIDKFALYTYFIGNAIYGIHPLLNNLIAILILIGIAVISVVISMPLFFKIASSQTENSIQKNHASNNICHKSTFFTFVRKEFLLSIRSISDFVANYLFLFIMPFVLIIMASVYIHIDRNNMGVAMTYGFIGLISLIMCSASNTASSTAISSEGIEFVLLKTAPGKTSNIVWAKLLVNAIISFVLVTISFISLSFVLKGFVELKLLWLIYVVVLLIDGGLILWSIQLDILNPKLKEYANSNNRSEVQNFSSSILIGCIVSAIFSVIMIFICLTPLSFIYKTLILVALGLAFLLIRLYFLINYTNAYFEDIQI